MSSVIDKDFEKRLSGLVNSGQPELLQGGKKGVEKESLRVTADGAIAQSPHLVGLRELQMTRNPIRDRSWRMLEDRFGDVLVA